MRITMIAPGSRGDVQPYIALGSSLAQAGHHVCVLSTNDFQTLATAYGLQFADIGGNAELLAQQHMQNLAEQGNLLKILAGTGRGAELLARQGAISGLAAAQGSDLLIGGLGGLFIGLALANKLGIPFLQAYLFPLTPTREFPSVMAPLPHTGALGPLNWLSHQLARQLLWQTFRAADTRARTEVLNLPALSFWGPFEQLQREQLPLLYGYSRHVLPPPGDWNGTTHVTGYWFLDPPADWQAPAELEAFLQSGPPPVYIGFGSMSSSKPEETADLVVQALARSGQRAVLYSGWGGLKKEQLPAHIFMTGALPHSWLFPRMAAVVHHGGAGTTAAGLAAGVPSIVVPFFGDQPFWAQRVSALGVGPQPIPRRRLNAENLAAAIATAINDAAMRTRAAELGRHIQAENGNTRAVALIEQALA